MRGDEAIFETTIQTDEPTIPVRKALSRVAPICHLTVSLLILLLSISATNAIADGETVGEEEDSQSSEQAEPLNFGYDSSWQGENPTNIDVDLNTAFSQSNALFETRIPESWFSWKEKLYKKTRPEAWFQLSVTLPDYKQ
jgi:hypothetical protein